MLLRRLSSTQSSVSHTMPATRWSAGTWKATRFNWGRECLKRCPKQSARLCGGNLGYVVLVETGHPVTLRLSHCVVAGYTGVSSALPEKTV